MVLPATLQNEEAQREALTRPGGDVHTNALHAWLVVGAPVEISLAIVCGRGKLLLLALPIDQRKDNFK
eukprot:4599994-Lingulodinium_polyedra.AAC.1